MRRRKYTLWLILFLISSTIISFCLPALAKTPHSNSSDLLSNQIIVIGLLLLLGFAGGKIIQLLKLPSVTGYVLIGILLGVSALNIIQNHMLQNLRFIEVLGLSLVALIIGGDLRLKKLKKLGKIVVIITFVQVMGAFLVVSIVTGWLLHLPWSIAIILGAISSATAPAATVAVIHEYKARGPLTDTLMAIVALDDAVCVILFSVVIAAAKLMRGSGIFSAKYFFLPAWHIMGSLLFGTIIGIIIINLMKWIRDRHELVILIVGFAFLFGEIVEHFHMSALLMNMMFGFVLVNFSPNPRLFNYFIDIELPVFVCFFTIAGAGLNIKILLHNWIPALVFIIARGIGKLSGVYVGGVLGQAPDVIKKYLGFGMLPQAGVAIALVLAVQAEFPDIAKLITALVLAAVAVNEIIGPLGTKFALIKANETNIPIHSEGKLN
jgi:Kef-type K+ transport system membrane component KefB